MFYNLAIYLFSALLWPVSLFNKKADTLRRGRRGLVERMEKDFASLPECQTLWMHCASLGEFEQGRTVIEAFKALEPTSRIVVTFFSPSGYEVRHNYSGADYIYYLPADTPCNARRVVRAIKPNIAIFVKYEYWHNYLKQLQNKGAQIYVISAIFRENMVFFKPWGGFFRAMLRRFTHLYVQNSQSIELLAAIGIQNVTVAGDTRFDRVAQITAAAPKLPIVEAFAKGQQVMVCGSTWPDDEKLLAKLITNHPETRFIIAPHQINENNIRTLLSALPQRTAALYTQTDERQVVNTNLLIINCIGILSGVYRYGQIAYIGGGFGAGIHNILEAATWGMPIIFGPRYQKFAEAVDLVNLGGAASIASEEELQTAYNLMQNNLNNISQVTKKYVETRCGATEIITRELISR